MGRIIIWTSVTALIFALFQAAILSNLLFLPVLPDLVLLVIVYVSFMNSSTTGVTVGFISGLLLDFLSAAPIGLNTFTKTLTGFIAGKFSGSFNLSKILIPATMGFCATILKVSTTLILSIFFGPEILNYNISGITFWLELFENTASAPLVFGLLGLFSVLFTERQRSTE